MKKIITAIMLINAISVAAQKTIIPAKNLVSKKWLANRSYGMIWYVLADTAKVEIGSTATRIETDDKNLTVITQVTMKRSASTWIDSSIARINDFTPVYHSSYNAQRNMVLNFGNTVTGYYKDNLKNSSTLISDTVTGKFFDSNFYPVLISWLPLQKKYTATISMYDYTPGNKSGLIKAYVNDVVDGIYKTKRHGLRRVWIVKVYDEIGGKNNQSESTYYIDKKDRRLWMQTVVAGERKMQMELKEQ